MYVRMYTYVSVCMLRIIELMEKGGVDCVVVNNIRRYEKAFINNKRKWKRKCKENERKNDEDDVVLIRNTKINREMYEEVE